MSLHQLLTKFLRCDQKYLILEGTLKGGLTIYYDNASVINNKSWNFDNFPTLPTQLEVNSYIILSKNIGTDYFNIQTYEKVLNNWLLKVGVASYNNNKFKFTYGNDMNGEIIIHKRKVYVERIRYATQDIYIIGGDTDKVSSIIDHGDFNVVSPATFMTITGIELI